jgi:hypothetical protein
MRNDPLIVRLRQRVVDEMTKRRAGAGGGGGGGGGGGWAVNTGRWGNRGNESSNVSSTNNGHGSYWNQNPVSYREHINRSMRGNKTWEGIRSAKKHRKKLEKYSRNATARSNRSHRSGAENRGTRRNGASQRNRASRRDGASQRNGASRRNGPSQRNGAARRNGPSRRASTSKGAAQLEKKIKQALIGEQYPWSQGPEVDARYSFEFENGINEIRQCNSLQLLNAISQLKPSSNMRNMMIAAARERMREVDTQNSYTPGSPFQ